MSKTRRDAMRTIVLGAAASIAVTPATAAPINPIAAVPDVDRHLIDLERRFDIAAATCREACSALESARQKALEVWPVVPPSIRLGGSPRAGWRWADPDEEPYCFVSAGWGYENGIQQDYTMRTVSNLHALLSNFGRIGRRKRSEKSLAQAAASLQRRAVELAEGERFHAECQAVRDRFGIDALATARQASWDQLELIVREVARAQAHSLTGLAIKAKVSRDPQTRNSSMAVLLAEMPSGIVDDIAWIAAAQGEGM